MKITAIQMNSQDSVERNLQCAEYLIREAHAKEPAALYVLPEYTPLYGATAEQIRDVAEEVPYGPISKFFARLAKELSVTIHCGTLNEPHGDKVYNTSVVFDADGKELCRYRKMHLFEATTASGRRVRETNRVDRGDRLTTFTLDDVTFGLATCYDSCFPEMFRALRRKGVQVILFVTASPYEEGEALHEAVGRTRAFESQCYIVGACQCGRSADGVRRSYGNTMIVDPLGAVIGRLGHEPGAITCEIDLPKLQFIRRRMDILKVADAIGLDKTAALGQERPMPVSRPDGTEAAIPARL